ncbi:hypothetical protein QTV44_002592 [Vibrio vulnificus]|nr:hypothetical protein [Vibrio vulnificus]
MALEVQHLLFEDIWSAIEARPDLEEYLSLIYPKFSARVRVCAFSVPELEDIRSKIKNYHSSLFYNLTIAIRLAGGVGEAAVRTGLTMDEFAALLHSGESSEHRSLANAFLEAKIVQSDFFEHQRPFFTDRQVARFRRLNISKLFALATDYTAFHSGLRELLSPHGEVLDALQGGEHCFRGSWACRKIECATGHTVGSLDRHPNGFM